MPLTRTHRFRITILSLLPLIFCACENDTISRGDEIGTWRMNRRFDRGSGTMYSMDTLKARQLEFTSAGRCIQIQEDTTVERNKYLRDTAEYWVVEVKSGLRIHMRRNASERPVSYAASMNLGELTLTKESGDEGPSVYRRLLLTRRSSDVTAP